MAVWPTSLPAPFNQNATVTFGDNSLKRTTQSGRTEITRWGSGAPDQWRLTFRIIQDNVGMFEQFYKVTLNMGVNWFSADWITNQLGYSDHKARIVDYPSLKVNGLQYRDYAVSIIIKPSANCPDDETWPTWS